MESQLSPLAQCGLTDTEQRVLFSLLSGGRKRASEVSKTEDIKRTTVYSALTSLERMGLVSKHAYHGTTFYAALDPASIPKVLVTKARARFEQVANAALQLESQLEEFQVASRTRFGGYEISTLESPEAALTYIEDILIKGNYLGIFNPQTAFARKQTKNIGLKCLKLSGRAQAPIREIAVRGPLCDWWISNIDNPNHRIIQVQMTSGLLTDQIITRNEVVLTNYSPGREMCIVIKHPDYHELMTEVFNLLWQSLQEE